MAIRKQFSLRKKMTGIIFLVSAIVLVLITIQFAYVEFRHLEDRGRDEIQSLATLISDNASYLMASKDNEGAQRLLSSLSAKKEIVSAYILLPDGKMLVGYSSSGARNEPMVTETEARYFAEGLKSGGDLLWKEDTRLAYFMPINLNGSQMGYTFLSLELTEIEKSHFPLVIGLLFVLITAVLFTYLLSAKVQKQITGSVEQLASRMSQITREKRLVGFVPKETDDELSQLFHGFDEMMRALRERDQLLESQRKDLELEVKVRTRALEAEKEKAELATIAKSKFLANMSHEIRTPMIGVLGMADILRQKGFSAQDQQLIETIYRSGESLLAILNDVLDFSKIEAGQLDLEPVPVDLVQVAEDVTRLMEVSAHSKGIELRFEAKNNVPVVMGDPGRIRQILLNLVGNAVKFTESGSVLVSLVTSLPPTEDVCDCLFVVQDTGVGITEDAQASIFNFFDQGDSRALWNYGGTGLGLAIVKELVELMAGDISVVSQPGEGSTFTVRLPLPVSSRGELQLISEQEESRPDGFSAEQLVPQKSASLGTCRHVLLAEDNPTTQNLISILLQQLGLELTVVDNGNDVIAALQNNTFDLILMDCQMPQMDGFQTTTYLRAHNVTTPIVALTAYARAEDEQHCLAAGMNDFLSKPFRQSELKEVLARWLGDDVLQEKPPVADHVS